MPGDVNVDLKSLIAAHSEHPWEQLGRCVFCGPCKVRLFQGTMPRSHKRYQRAVVNKTTDTMRSRWHMDDRT